MPHVDPDWNIKFCARLGFNDFWFVKCMKLRKLETEIISI